MGVTAEFLAQTQGISREEQDAFALRSHQRAAAAQAKGEFKREIVPVWGRDEAGNRILVERDQCVRADATHGKLWPRSSRPSCPAWAPSRPATARR